MAFYCAILIDELSWFALSDAQKVVFVLSSRKNTRVINSLSPII